MVLKIERTYTTKAGEVREFKQPLMKVMGKNMDRDESAEFVILSDTITVFDNSLYPNYRLFVTYDQEDAEAFNLDLSNQAYKEISGLDFRKGDKLKIKKAYFTNKKTGAEMPIIKAEITNRDVPRTGVDGKFNKNIKQDNSGVKESKPVSFPVEVEQYTEMFDKSIKANPRPVNLHDFIATYFRLEANKLPVIDKLVEEYNKRYPDNKEQNKDKDKNKDKESKKDEPVKPTKPGSKK